MRVLLLAVAFAAAWPLPPLWRTAADSLGSGAGLGASAAFSDPTALLDVPRGATLYGHSTRHMPGEQEVDQLDADPVVHTADLFGLRVGLAFTVEGEYGHPPLDTNDPKFPVGERLEGRMVGWLWAADFFGLRVGGARWLGRARVAPCGEAGGDPRLEALSACAAAGQWLVAAGGARLPFAGRVTRAVGGPPGTVPRTRWRAPLPLAGECAGETGAGAGCRVAVGPLQAAAGRLWGEPTSGLSTSLPFGLRLHLAWGEDLLPHLLGRPLPSMRDVHTYAVTSP